MMFDTTTFVAPRQAAAARLQAPEPEPAGCPAADFRRDSQFVQMLRGYRGSGGMARRSEVLGLPALRCLGAEEALAAWMESGHVCSLVLARPGLAADVPVHPAGHAAQPALKAVADELAPAFVGCGACFWFAEPHAALGGQRPAERLVKAPAALRQAPRADRYAVLG